MSSLAAIRNLIDNVTGINVKYEPLERAHRFNIFSILRRGHEEVNPHFSHTRPDGALRLNNQRA
jgi:hypothetical protein